METSSRGDARSDLRADCSRCVGLCCVALPFAASADFGHDKPAGEPCRHLSGESSCGIHDRLRSEGYRGCAVFDCFGAGQQVTQVTFGGADWRDGPETAGRMFAAFGVMRPLHELLWYLIEAEALLRAAATGETAATEEADRLLEELAGLLDEVRRATRTRADQVGQVDVAAYHRAADPLLLRVSELERAGLVARREHRGADLAGADLAGADLRAAGLRGAVLISADLRGADLRGADVLGADLRDADLAGADLTGCLFLTRPQVESARGDAATRLPEGFDRPAHWA